MRQSVRGGSLFNVREMSRNFICLLQEILQILTNFEGKKQFLVFTLLKFLRDSRNWDTSDSTWFEAIV